MKIPDIRKEGDIITYKKSNNVDYKTVRIKKHYDKNGCHNHVILEDFEDKHVSVGLSTKVKKGKNSPNYKCDNDILGGNKTSYMRRQGTVAPQKEYSKTERQGKMTYKDFAKAQEYGARAKAKYKQKK